MQCSASSLQRIIGSARTWLRELVHRHSPPSPPPRLSKKGDTTGNSIPHSPPPLPPDKQNHLHEFYNMCEFVAPGVLGTPSAFARVFANAIIAGSRPDASDTEKELGEARAQEVSTLVPVCSVARNPNV